MSRTCSSEAPDICCTALIRADQPTFSVRGSVSANGRPVKNTAAARRSSSRRSRRYSARAPIFFSFEVVPEMTSAVSANPLNPLNLELPLDQNLETLAHRSGENQFFYLQQTLHRFGVSAHGQFLDLKENAPPDEVVHLRGEQGCFQQGLVRQIGEIDMCGHILFADPDVRVFRCLMMPVAHQGTVVLSVIFVPQISVVDGKMISPIERRSDVSNPPARLQAYLGDLAFRDRELDLNLKRAIDLFEVFIDVDLPQNSAPADHAVYGQRIEEFIRENAAAEAL